MKRTLKQILRKLFHESKITGKAEQETLEHGLTIRAFIENDTRKLLLYRTRRMAPSPLEARTCAKHANFASFTVEDGKGPRTGLPYLLVSEEPAWIRMLEEGT
jgi:hypothetical protein